jgi:tetratricopeptide (TPR) repeat protein
MFSHLGLEDLAAHEVARGLEVDPTSDALRQTKLLMYEVQSRLDDYAADPTVSRDGRMQALYLMAKGRFDEAQKVVDAWAATPSAGASVVSTQALLRAAHGDFRGAEADIPIVLAEHPLKDPIYHHAAYDIACIYALEGKSADAVKWLRESAVWGYHLYPRYMRDPYLNRIRQSPEFVQFVAEMKTEHDTYRRDFSERR